MQRLSDTTSICEDTKNEAARFPMALRSLTNLQSFVFISFVLSLSSRRQTGGIPD